MKRLSILFCIIFSIFSALVWAFHVFGIYVNITPSIPVGFYVASADPIEKGEYVVVCPPDKEIFRLAKKRGYISSGFCPAGYGYLMKKVYACYQDNVRFSQAGVFVNKDLLKNSEAMRVDVQGREMPLLKAGATILKKGELLLMGQSDPISFDARYFGLIPENSVVAVVKPLWLFGGARQ